MPVFHDLGRAGLRRMYVETWRKHRASLPIEPLEDQIVRIVELHPEYQPALETADPASLARDFTPEDGQSNPFLHMGLHLAIREQVSTDRPGGVRAIHAELVRRLGDLHAAEHCMIECLGEALWQGQRSGLPPDESAYLEALRTLARRA